MNRLTKVTGYTLAALMVPLVLASLMGMDFWGHKLVSITGISISPWYTGSEVVRKIDHGKYETRIHRPVFDGLLWQTRQGFVQVDWAPLQSIPSSIDEAVDCDGDGIMDFRVELDVPANTARVTPLNKRSATLEGIYQLKDAHSVRVTLHR